MGRRGTKLRDLVGAIKDKASQSKAAIFSRPNTLSLLRATTHNLHTPPNPKHLAAVLAFGHSSRATVSAAVEILMDRLQNTGDASVALKCLVAVHHIVKFGTFILQDQLSVFPFHGGRNYLNLSRFRDNSSHVTWQLSTWVRWYAEYVENLLSTSRVLGFFLGSSSSATEEERVSASWNGDLIKETESLASLFERICAQPELDLSLNGNRLVDDIRGLVGQDYLSVVNEVSIRVTEFGDRLSCLSFVDSVELICALRRLENCRERLQLSSNLVKKDLSESLWDLISEIKEKFGREKENREDNLVVALRKDKGTESARFGDRVFKFNDSVRFSSGRFATNYRHSLPFVGSTE
ncbi:putative clathrin assembly protein At4g40080 [Humulus lupulus]|uniref:putative clathrin assembly protein At4g40080 n=1 Tax=Humulus lupulus TaxID=3486 RepID=UPI002B40FC74|nr:putative clathrin assembly protein At4g40080 [Humulus lupulus]